MDSWLVSVLHSSNEEFEFKKRLDLIVEYFFHLGPKINISVILSYLAEPFFQRSKMIS